MGNIKCENCNCETFIDDLDRGVELENPIFDMGGQSIFTRAKIFMKCSNCGWQLPNEIINKPSEIVTLTFCITPDKGNDLNEN